MKWNEEKKFYCNLFTLILGVLGIDSCSGTEAACQHIYLLK
jgi:hypothetical protein